MNSVEKFWAELKEACQESQIEYTETKNWINASVKDIATTTKAYYISVLPPVAWDKVALDIVIVTDSIVHLFTYYTQRKSEHTAYLLRAFLRYEEKTTRDRVVAEFHFSGEKEASFFIADRIENLAKLRSFLAEFGNIAGGAYDVSSNKR
jgi:hypothetical protein